jgi:hypothetical protein
MSFVLITLVIALILLVAAMTVQNIRKVRIRVSFFPLSVALAYPVVPLPLLWLGAPCSVADACFPAAQPALRSLLIPLC